MLWRWREARVGVCMLYFGWLEGLVEWEIDGAGKLEGYLDCAGGTGID